jgi:galactonate dehydratase
LGPVSTAACIQVDFAAPNFVIQEIVDPDVVPAAMEFVKEPLPIVDGHILPPDKPGIGVEIDEAACAKYVPDFSSEKIGQRIRGNYGAFHADGGVADS